MYAVISMPLVRRTRATLRRAEFGFFGVFVYTRVQTPRRWGAPLSAGVLVLVVFDWRPLRTSCWIVGTKDRGYLESTPCINRASTPSHSPAAHSKVLSGGRLSLRSQRRLRLTRPRVR